jgi:hypothetical protein
MTEEGTRSYHPRSFCHYRGYGYVPLCIFEGTSHALMTACLRPGHAHSAPDCLGLARKPDDVAAGPW